MLPIWLKISYSAFSIVLAPVYVRQYGWGNFLWFSDIALLLGCAALWLESPLLASSQAIAIAVPESVWIVEFVLRLTAGVRIAGLTDYMFDASIPRLVRALSLFHLWLPPLLVWMTFRLGYDPRAFLFQTAVGSAVLIASHVLTAQEENVNWVHRVGKIGGVRALALCLVLFPLVFYLPAHLVLKAVGPAPPRLEALATGGSDRGGM